MKKNIFLLLGLIGTLLMLVACSDTHNESSLENDESNGKTTKEKSEKTPYESIILNENHPHYFDDIDSVLSFAKEHSKKEVAVDVIGGKSYSKYGDETIITYKGFEHDGYITGIEIYLDKIDKELNVNDSMALVDSYLSSELIQQNYSVVESAKLIPKDESKTENIVIKYQLDEEKKDDELFCLWQTNNVGIGI